MGFAVWVWASVSQRGPPLLPRRELRRHVRALQEAAALRGYTAAGAGAEAPGAPTPLSTVMHVSTAEVVASPEYCGARRPRFAAHGRRGSMKKM